MANFIRIKVTPQGKVSLRPENPFSEAVLAPAQADELIQALQDALGEIQNKKSFARAVEIESWVTP